MGFSKRIITREQTLDYLNKGELDTLYQGDVHIFYDDLSHQVFELYLNGTKETEIKKKLNIH
jgi:hypothetical protein